MMLFKIHKRSRGVMRLERFLALLEYFYMMKQYECIFTLLDEIAVQCIEQLPLWIPSNFCRF